MRETMRRCGRQALLAALGAFVVASSVATGQSTIQSNADLLKYLEVPGNGRMWRPKSGGGFERSEEWRLLNGTATTGRSRGWANYTSSNRPEVDDGDGDRFELFYGQLFDEFVYSMPLNFGLLESPNPGDFLPVGETVAADTLPLSPANGTMIATGWQGLNRATLHGQVDLVTGVPLTRFTDLTLPFNGSQFRLIRTRSAEIDVPRWDGPEAGRSYAENHFWDWLGNGWMMSENPLLIVDSTMADHVGKGTPRVWLWLDAFRSIPFDWIEDSGGTGRYDCAPRYRAKLKISRSDSGTIKRKAVTDGSAALAEVGNGMWEPGFEPDKYTIELYDGEIVLEFTPVWQDVPTWPYKWLDYPLDPDDPTKAMRTSLHERPLLPLSSKATDGISEADAGRRASRNPLWTTPLPIDWTIDPPKPEVNGRGMGMPYYGLLTRIKDKFGNRAEFKYAPLTEWTSSTPMFGGSTPARPVQTTTQKGMLTEVRLLSGSETAPTVHWTLVYGYRLVPRTSGGGMWPRNGNLDWWKTDAPVGETRLTLTERIAASDPVLEAIYVFAGNVTTNGAVLLRHPNESRSMEPMASPSAFWPTTESDDLLQKYRTGQTASIRLSSSAGDLGNPSGPSWKFRCRYDHSLESTVDSGTGQKQYWAFSRPMLLTRVRTDVRGESSPSTVQTRRNLVFQYSAAGKSSRMHWLKGAFDDQGVSAACGMLTNSPGMFEDQCRYLALDPRPETFGDPEWRIRPSGGRYTFDDYARAALFWSQKDDLPWIDSAKLMQDGLLDGEPSRHAYDGYGGGGRNVVRLTSLVDEQGKQRHYLVSRFLRAPQAISSASPVVWGGFTDQYRPMRSLFTSPFLWQCFPTAYSSYAAYPLKQTQWPTFEGGPFTWKTGASSESSISSVPVEYDQARWIVFIDEFPTRKEAEAAVHHDVDAVAGGAAKQSFFKGSTARRIVGMNPLGYVLYDKRFDLQWQESNYVWSGRFTESGDLGLTERYIYKNGQALLNDLVIEGVASSQDANSAPKELKSELFLVERRTAGWSAAAPRSTLDPANGKAEGLVEVFGYTLLPEVNGQAENARPTLAQRLKMHSVGLQRGNDSEGIANRVWKSQTFFDPGDPSVVWGQAQFTDPNSDLFPLPATASDLLTIEADASAPILSRTKQIKTKDGTSGNYTKMEMWSIAPAQQPSPYGTAKMYDVSISITGADGLTPWSITAAVADPESTSRAIGDAVRFDYTEFDSYGRVINSWIDVDPAVAPNGLQNTGAFATAVGLLPAGFANRLSASPTVAQFRTQNLYDEDGLSDTIYANGKRWARRVALIKVSGDDSDYPSANYDRDIPPDLDEEVVQIKRVFEFPLLVPQLDGTFMPAQPCTIREYKKWEGPGQFWAGGGSASDLMGGARRGASRARGWSLVRERYVRFLGAVQLSSLPIKLITPADFVIPTPIAYGYDSMGRLNRIEELEVTGDCRYSALAERLDDGDRVRLNQMDSNKFYEIRNVRGQSVREYAGTWDRTWNDSTWPTTIDPSGTQFDMMLRSRSEYGDGPTNARQLIRRWTYREQPASWTPSQLAPFGPPPSANDGEGEVTETRYDWRMRPVRVDVLGPGTNNSTRPRLSTKLTILDHADRVRFEVSYGPGTLPSLSSIDPSTFTPLKVMPTASAILGTTPVSLVETVYNANGTVRERRTYRTALSGSPSTAGQYTTERYGYGAGGSQIFAERPNSLIQKATIDNLGRVLVEAMVLSNGDEHSRTEYAYDSDGNVIVTDRFERLPGATGATLGTSNAVRSRTENWYDVARKLVATVEYGTGNTGGTFANATLPTFDQIASGLATRLQDGPELKVQGSGATRTFTIRLGTATNTAVQDSVSAGALLTLHAYDTGGNKIATRRADGMVTVFEYDAKNRLTKQIDDFCNLSTSGTVVVGARRETNYHYWLGRTIAVSAKRRSDDTVEQYQGVAYGAQLVATQPLGIDHDGDNYSGQSGQTGTLPQVYSDFVHISNDNSLVAAMLSVNPDSSPDTPLKGLPDTVFNKPDLLFRYYADGLIAERIDRRGVAMRYYYDDFRRLVATEVWHYPLAQPGMSHPLTSAALVAPVEYAPPCSGSSTPPPDEPPAPPAAKPGYPVAMNPTTGDPPVDRVGYIKYEYDARGNLTLVTARTGRYASSIITQTKYEYDERNNLTKEYQAHGQEATASGVAVVSYTRTYTQATPTTSGRDRLTSMTYPLTSPSLSGPYSFGFSYGATNSADDAAGRITAITRGATSIGAFTYTGSGRRVAMSMGGTATSPLIQQTFDTATTAGLEGLDRFGRSRDLHFRTTATTPTTLWRGEYTYDTAGNRTTERLAQRAPGYSALTGINERSRAFSYDSLDRLVGTKTGPLNSGNSITTPHRNEQWVLDLLGNWNGNYSTQAPAFTACDSPTIVNPGGGQFTTEPNPEGGPGGATPSLVPGHAVDEYDATGNATRVLAEAHRVAQQNPATDPLTHSTALASNAIAQIQKQTANGPAWELFRYDPNGNLTYDGKYFYQYDAWNRLVQVNDATTLHWHWFDLLGMFKLRPVGPQWPPSCPAPVLGPPIKSFVYDGVGRLARTISPITAPEGYYFAVPTGNAPPAAQYTYVTAINRSERFYYDGVRRIQEVVTNPLLVNEEHDIVTMAEELYQQNQGNTLYTGAMFTRAQYVWGPGDNGPDELLCMLDPRDSSHSSYQTLGGKPWYVLTDAQGDLVSLVHQPGATGAAQVAGQWTYSPYGQVLTYDSYVPHPVVVFGHKTLVVDRLDTAALFWNTDDGTVTEAQRLQPGVRLLAYARNRTLDIERGRWLQQDPNASGIIIAASMAIQGTPIRSMQQIISVNNRMQDGLSLYGYCVTNPVLQRDPSGLSIVGVGIGVTGGLLVPGPGDFVQGALTSLVSQYAEHQEWDVEWALDWSAGDDWHSRLDNSWVNVAMAQGVYDAFRIGVGEYSFNPLDAFASGSVGGGTRAAKSAARLSRSLAGLGSHILNILRDLKSIPTAIPSSWGRGKLAKVMDKAGAVVEVGREAGTTIYKLPDGSEVRVMPRPNRSDIAQKMAGPYYYRSRPSGDAPWGPPVSLSKE